MQRLFYSSFLYKCKVWLNGAVIKLHLILLLVFGMIYCRQLHCKRDINRKYLPGFVSVPIVCCSCHHAIKPIMQSPDTCFGPSSCQLGICIDSIKRFRTQPHQLNQRPQPLWNYLNFDKFKDIINVQLLWLVLIFFI